MGLQESDRSLRIPGKETTELRFDSAKVAVLGGPLAATFAESGGVKKEAGSFVDPRQFVMEELF